VTVVAAAGVTINGTPLTLSTSKGGSLVRTASNVWTFTPTGGAGGKVLQVVSATTNTLLSTTSTTFVTSGLTATITPTLASSKVLIITSMSINASSHAGYVTLFRGSVAGTNLVTNVGLIILYTGGNVYGNGSTNFLDSPATVGAQVYTVGIRSFSGSTTIAQMDATTSSMILMEIGA
jgi:hypothetical protein